MERILTGIVKSFFLCQPPDKAYNSEASLQLKLGIELWRQLKVEPTLEHHCQETNEYLDILVKYKNDLYGIELKYKTKKVQGFNYTNQGAHYNGRYDFFKDVSRVESFIQRKIIHAGFSILVTNDKTYWTAIKSGNRATKFQLTNDTTLAGEYAPDWKSRSETINLRGEYKVQWIQPSNCPNDRARFQALVFKSPPPVCIAAR